MQWTVIVSARMVAVSQLYDGIIRFQHAYCSCLQDHLLPMEYVSTMRDHLLDKCPVSR